MPPQLQRVGMVPHPTLFVLLVDRNGETSLPTIWSPPLISSSVSFVLGEYLLPRNHSEYFVYFHQFCTYMCLLFKITLCFYKPYGFIILPIICRSVLTS